MAGLRTADDVDDAINTIWEQIQSDSHQPAKTKLQLTTIQQKLALEGLRLRAGQMQAKPNTSGFFLASAPEPPVATRR